MNNDYIKLKGHLYFCIACRTLSKLVLDHQKNPPGESVCAKCSSPAHFFSTVQFSQKDEDDAFSDGVSVK